MIKNTVYLICLLLLISSCQRKSYRKADDGITVHLKKAAPGSAKLVRLQVLSDKIIHVTASPSNSFPGFESLITAGNNTEPVIWSMEEGESEVILNTSCIKASVSLSTGNIVFRDTAGNVILSEEPGGGKTFTPVSVEGKQFYGIHQVFESPDDEAFYGLGQHQNGQMNYKGEDVELAQHNIVAVVPFLYSNKNYGILWDNYSITRFGDPREFQQISNLQLFSGKDEPGGLTAEYYGDNGLLLSRQENKIDYQYIQSFSNIPEGIRIPCSTPPFIDNLLIIEKKLNIPGVVKPEMVYAILFRFNCSFPRNQRPG